MCSRSSAPVSACHFVYCMPRRLFGTDKIPSRPVAVSKNGARVLPLEEVPVPGHGAEMFARAPTKSSVQTSARAREPGTGTETEWGLRLCSH